MERSPKNEIIAFFMAFLLPGAGHFYAGRRLKGAIFFLVLVSLFSVGVALNGVVFPVTDIKAFANSLPPYQLIIDKWTNYLSYVAHFSNFLPCLAVYASGLDRGDVAARYSEVGTTMVLLAGLLNILLMFNAADCAREANWLAANPQAGDDAGVSAENSGADMPGAPEMGVGAKALAGGAEESAAQVETPGNGAAQ